MQLDNLRVLIISPHFPPVNTADMQRVRMLLPFFKENGWLVEVLAVSPEQVAAPTDDWLLGGLPDDVPIHRVNVLGLAWSRIPGLGSLGFRALHALKKAGDHLLGHKKFDLIYFSTTVFPVHQLGPRWKKKYSIPFVMDYQDPWVNDYYREHPEIAPPGGRLKHALVDRLHRHMEPRVLKQCAGITSVSESYPMQIKLRYPEIKPAPVLVQAFPGAKLDFERLSLLETSVFDKTNGKLNWLYIGRGGADMATALRGLFSAIRDHTDEDFKKRLCLHFIGTSYASAGKGQKTVSPIAAEYGLENIVIENPDRMAYSKTLQYLKQADALVVPGSDDPAYTASKIYPYLLAQRPMLAIFHEKSSVIGLIEKVGGAVCVAFSANDSASDLSRKVKEKWLLSREYDRVQSLDDSVFFAYSDAGCAKELTDFFNQVLANA